MKFFRNVLFQKTAMHKILPLLCFLVAPLFQSSAAHALELKSELKPAPFNPALKLKAIGKTHVLMENTEDTNRLLLIAHASPEKAIGLAIAKSEFIDAKFSEDSSLLLLAARSMGSQVLNLYETRTGKRLATNKDGIDKIQEIFWIDDCRYGAIVAPLKNGGKMKIVLRQDDPRCKEFLPQKGSAHLVSIWRDAHFNVFGRYSDSSLELLKWIGEGTFTDFLIGQQNQFLFRSMKKPELLFFADSSRKKIQPLGAYEMALAMPSAGSFLVYDGEQLLLVSWDTKFNLVREPLLARGIEEMHWIVPGQRALLFSERAGYQILNLR